MKKALVLGAGGFIGHHLVSTLEKKGFWVRGVDLKSPEYSKSKADDFLICDLKNLKLVEKSFCSPGQNIIKKVALLLLDSLTIVLMKFIN